MQSLNPPTSAGHDAKGLQGAPIVQSHHIRADRLRTYDIYITLNTIDACCNILKELIGPRVALLVTTPTVSQLYSREIYQQLRCQNGRVSCMVLNCNEATKSIDQVIHICERALNTGLDRTGLLVAVGGGVCTDIVTVAASWIRRGIDHIRVPTTLIGQVDAGIAVKGAVNFCGKKSYLGCFYPPRAVVITPAFLQTLPRNQLRAGFAEIIKMAIVTDQRLFELVEKFSLKLLASGFRHLEDGAKEVLGLSIARMLEELEPNIYEDQTYQRLVDFGHTFSPALEAGSNFSISHGEAVAIDMALSAVLARQLGLLSGEISARLLSVLVHLGLPIWSPLLTTELCQRGLREVTLHRGGRPNLVVPTGIGKAVFLGQMDALASHIARAIHTLKAVGRQASSERTSSSKRGWKCVASV
jgi:2-epi-5-epi-valiolone synthase